MSWIKGLKANFLLRVVSANSLVIAIRLTITLAIQRILAKSLEEYGIAKIGDLRNIMAMLTSFTSMGIFNGMVKFVSQNENEPSQLKELLSTSFIFALFGSLISSLVLAVFAETFSVWFFDGPDFADVFYILAVIAPAIGLQRIFNAVVHGMSRVKKYAIIELVAYIISAILTLAGLYFNHLKGVLLAISIGPLIQLLTLVFIFGKTLKPLITSIKPKWHGHFGNALLAFTLMSFVSNILLNSVEIYLREVLERSLNINEAGYWTAITNISKNYMVFSTALFSLYVIPKFAKITTGLDFKTEVLYIYKTLLPLFGVGMLLIFVFRDFVVQLIYPNFEGMEPLFKWQLLGDFVRLAAVVVAHQFLAKKMIRSFIASEIVSMILFFGLSLILIPIFGTEGVVMSHFVRYVIYFGFVLLLIQRHFARTA
ncbi:MAG: O-antigen translocase [Flavobacteriaceae bacterium]